MTMFNQYDMIMSDEGRDLVSTGLNMSAYQWGPRLGTRLLPGIGTAIMAYQMAPFAYGAASWAYEKYTGRNLDETTVGSTLLTAGSYVDAGVGKAQRFALNGISGTLSMLGWSSAAEKTSNFADWYLQDQDGNKIAANQSYDSFNESPDRAITQQDIPVARYTPHMNLKDKAILARMEAGQAPSSNTITLDEAFKSMKPVETEITSERARETQIQNKIYAQLENNPQKSILEIAQSAFSKPKEQVRQSGMEMTR